MKKQTKKQLEYLRKRKILKEEWEEKRNLGETLTEKWNILKIYYTKVDILRARYGRPELKRSFRNDLAVDLGDVSMEEYFGEKIPVYDFNFLNNNAGAEVNEIKEEFTILFK